MRIFDESQGIMQHRQRAQAEKIHFQQTQFLDVLHGILGHHLALVAFIERQVFSERFGRDHHPSGMRGSVSHQTFERLGGAHQPRASGLPAGRFPATWALP